MKIRVGLFGFGKTGKLVEDEFIKDDNFNLTWVVKNIDCGNKYASRLLGYEEDCGKIFAAKNLDKDFFKNNRVDVIIDFSHQQALYYYENAAKLKIPIISAVSHYEQAELKKLEDYSQETAVLYSPNITLGINVLIVAAQILQKIAPHADIEIIEEHFKSKQEISGTAKKIASNLELGSEKIHAIRVGGIVGKHEIVFGMPNQTIRLTHESISRAAFGQGAIFAAKFLVGKSAGLYNMEYVISDMFRNNIPVY